MKLLITPLLYMYIVRHMQGTPDHFLRAMSYSLRLLHAHVHKRVEVKYHQPIAWSCMPDPHSSKGLATRDY